MTLRSSCAAAPLVALFLSCATSHSADLSTVEQALAERAKVTVSLPRFDVPAETPEEVDRLLSRPLTADDAARIALLSNRDGRAALAELGIARGQYVQAGLLPNPEFAFEVRAPGGAQPPQLDFGLELSLSEMAMAPVRSSVMEAHLEAEKLRAVGTLLDLAYHARLAFLDVQALQTKLSLRLEVLRNQQAAYATALELSNAGNLPAIALANELAAVETSRVQVAELENMLLDAREVLNQRLGLHGARTTWTIERGLELPSTVPDAADAEKRALAASLEVLELSHRAESASRKVGLAKTEGWVPHVSAGFHGERDADLWELGGHVAIGLPVFDRQQGRQVSAESEYEAHRERAEAAATTLRSIVRMTLNRLESANKRARHYADRLVPAKQRQLKETVLQYNAMSLGVFQVLQVQRGVTEASIAQVDATLDYWRAHAAFELLLAGRSTPLQRAAAIPSSATPMAAEGGH